jgi:GST-like protein
VKVSIFLGESSLPYKGASRQLRQRRPGVARILSLNPNNKIPAIIGPTGPTGSRCRCSSCAILITG